MAIDPREQWEKLQKRIQVSRQGFGSGGGFPGGGGRAASRGVLGLVALGIAGVAISNSIFNGVFLPIPGF